MILTVLCCAVTPAHAYSGYAYSMGGEFHSGQDVISAADYWRMCGYTSYYTNNPTYSYMSSANRLNSDILYFSAHGNQYGVYFQNNLSLTTGTNNGVDRVGIDSYSLTNTRLVIYDACLTASGTSNLCTATINRGADAVIGWQESIEVNDALKWEKRFQEYCLRGYKVHLAMDYADSFSDYNYNYEIKSHLIYGNWTQVIKRTTASNVDVLSEETVCRELESTPNRIIDIEEIACDINNIKYSEIETAISNNIVDFEPSNYTITVTPTNSEKTSYVVDYTLNVEGFSTSNGYTLIFKENKANVIYNNSIENANNTAILDIGLNKGLSSKALIESNRDSALFVATEQLKQMNSSHIITSQTITPYYDVLTGNCYLKVLTKYDYMGKGYYGAFSTLYPINNSSVKI